MKSVRQAIKAIQRRYRVKARPAGANGRGLPQIEVRAGRIRFTTLAPQPDNPRAYANFETDVKRGLREAGATIERKAHD
jgi:hypothetical protein